MDRILSGTIKEIVVAYKDRMCRFGYELIKQICKKFDTKLVVINKSEAEQNSTVELSKDLLSIVTVFVARNNGLRAGKNRKKREEGKRSEIENEKESGSENDPDCIECFSKSMTTEQTFEFDFEINTKWSEFRFTQNHFAIYIHKQEKKILTTPESEFFPYIDYGTIENQKQK